MVHLTKIYTRTGDHGKTRLSDMSLAAKTDLRVEAYGQVDEANAVLGVATARGDLPTDLQDALRLIQNELFDLGADLSTPLAENPPWEPLRIIQASIDRLEGWCDEYSSQVGKLDSFILPGGTQTAAQLHVARTIVRRAERTAWRAAEAHGLDVEGGLNPLAITYLNRLSDLLFLAARVANTEVGDVLWVPGTDRAPAEPKAAKRRRRAEQVNEESDAD
ncbi:cob(I)yrinic acid a,c-diamide adenosyltransferase [Micropruina sonneratiae]|uniref:cob(I)yrinic acid a,c-diamide adenosyltransferase n=1 Tax=Micropruina sonneratiae TaxID=2986940 RepID=UPI002225C038|nr:cob(I)yrinic acid a,c-diamide adenosyltransferase [Micropruina sp. KQZ13P-5]MCW3157543.1 cob(I)yrinic acid a,c-diamide adenosyltransferase [Micropruina sp. KQZ13P-5]